MYKVLGIVLALCLLQDTIAYCCFRDAYTLPCGCTDIETNGLFYSPCTSTCGVATSCGGVAGSCFRDVSNVCTVCDNPSPVRSCLKSVEGSCGGCGGKVGCGCGKELIYFPEVEYPVVAVEMKPYYYGSCFCI